MNSTLKGIGIVLLVGAILWLAYSWEVFKYHECKKVGHSTTYCIFMVGSK